MELFLHPGQAKLAVRHATKQDRNAIQWGRKSETKAFSKQIPGSAFLPNLYELFGWNPERKYRIIGVKKQYGEDALLLFNLTDTEVLIPNTVLQSDGEEQIPAFEENVKPLGTKKSILAYPASWTYTFGNNYYCQAQANELAKVFNDRNWNIWAEGMAFHPEPPLKITSKIEIEQSIEKMIDDMRQEVTGEQNNTNE